jgi:predicted histidine transporter YuiF (NhaC family)
MVRVLEKTIANLDKNHPLQFEAHHSLLIYTLKAGMRKRYLKKILAFQVRFGFRFIPISFKQTLKYTLKGYIKQNRTTSEMEKIWNNKNEK